jgi:hypothetical protein
VIERHDKTWGELVLATTLAKLPGGQLRTLQLVADNIAVAFSAESQHEQQHRLVLMEERAVIARELHDSLAQNFSYLKIQISRFQMLQAKGASPATALGPSNPVTITTARPSCGSERGPRRERLDLKTLPLKALSWHCGSFPMLLFRLSLRITTSCGHRWRITVTIKLWREIEAL